MSDLYYILNASRHEYMTQKVGLPMELPDIGGSLVFGALLLEYLYRCTGEDVRLQAGSAYDAPDAWPLNVPGVPLMNQWGSDSEPIVEHLVDSDVIRLVSTEYETLGRKKVPVSEPRYNLPLRKSVPLKILKDRLFIKKSNININEKYVPEKEIWLHAVESQRRVCISIFGTCEHTKILRDPRACLLAASFVSHCVACKLVLSNEKLLPDNNSYDATKYYLYWLSKVKFAAMGYAKYNFVDPPDLLYDS